MAAAGWEHTHAGRYIHRTSDVHAARYQLSFFSHSGNAVLQLLPAGARSSWQGVAAEVVGTDDELARFLAKHNFPAGPAHPST